MKNVSELKTNLEKMAKHYKAFEHAMEVADILVNAQQVKSEYDKSIADAKKELADIAPELAAAKAELAKAKDDAKIVVENATAKAGKIVSDAEELAASKLSLANDEVGEMKIIVASLKDEEKKIIALNAEKIADLEKIGKAIEAAQNKLKQFVGS